MTSKMDIYLETFRNKLYGFYDIVICTGRSFKNFVYKSANDDRVATLLRKANIEAIKIISNIKDFLKRSSLIFRTNTRDMFIALRINPYHPSKKLLINLVAMIFIAKCVLEYVWLTVSDEIYELTELVKRVSSDVDINSGLCVVSYKTNSYQEYKIILRRGFNLNTKSKIYGIFSDSKEVTDIIMPFAGPMEDFHMQRYTPSDFGFNSLSLRFSPDGDLQRFESNETIIVPGLKRD